MGNVVIVITVTVTLTINMGVTITITSTSSTSIVFIIKLRFCHEIDSFALESVKLKPGWCFKNAFSTMVCDVICKQKFLVRMTIFFYSCNSYFSSFGTTKMRLHPKIVIINIINAIKNTIIIIQILFKYYNYYYYHDFKRPILIL